ncbi:MAG: TldD/PmbA family protein [Candidatus Thermoplasmatota archaeon]|nr:TldD/PmbA family protein [Candidatus Thermoplasmatota archaeon]
MNSKSNLLSICESVIKTAKSLGADDSDALVILGDESTFNVEKNRISAVSAKNDFGIGIRVLKEGKMGFSFCTQEAQIRNAVERAIAMSRHTKNLKFAFPEPAKLPKVSGKYDAKIPQIQPEDGMEMAEMIVNSAREISARVKVSGGIGYGYGESALANSRGLSVYEKGTHFSASASASIGSATGSYISASRVYDVDPEDVGGSAADIAQRSLRPKKADGGAKTVVFSPFAISQMLEFITVPALYGEKAHRGESVYSGKIGQTIVNAGLSIYDDQILTGGLNSGETDDEGVPSAKVPIVENGILKNFLCDLRCAYEFGDKPTSNGMRGFQTPAITSARNVVLKGNNEKFASLVKDIKNGIFAYDVLGAHTANPASGDFSMSSSTLFEIKNGEIGRALKPVMLGGNLPKLLGKVRLADDVKMLPGSLSHVCIVVPSVALEGVSVSV